MYLEFMSYFQFSVFYYIIMIIVTKWFKIHFQWNFNFTYG
jgi:hypothetical protein